MSSPFKFAEFSVDPKLGRIAGPNDQVHLEPKIMDVLVTLYLAQGEVVSREAILQRVWPNQEVSDDVINNAISRIRKALAQVGESNRCVETVPRKGYRLVNLKPNVATLNIVTETADQLLDKAVNSHKKSAPGHSVNDTTDNKQNSQTELGSSVPLTVTKVLGTDTANDSVANPVSRFASRRLIGVVLLCLLAAVLIPFLNAKWQHNNLVEQIQSLGELQKASYSAFVIQAKRRNELVKMIELRLSIDRTQQFEKFFSKYFEQMSSEERFVFDQIRGITEGALHSANKEMLQLVNDYPEIGRVFPLVEDLKRHLSFWLSKYDNVFMQREDMCLLYVGVEDEVPYPSDLDKQVTKWLESNASL